MDDKRRLSAALIVITAGLSVAGGSARAQTCKAAKAWVSPGVVSYATVLRDADESRSEPNLSVFVELSDGSAGEIDPGSVTLNGLPALSGPSAVADANENGIADLMVKFNRRVLITSDGALKVVGNTASGECITAETRIDIRCLPDRVARSDYFIDFKTTNMPDATLNDLPAQLAVRRVSPVFPRNCGHIAPIRALVLVHGRTVTAPALFDLAYGDYSLMEKLAMRGIDTFAADHLGFGLSSLLSGTNPLADPCNASLPQCAVLPGATCKAIEGVCDCRQGLPVTQSMDQQGSPRYLKPNPLTARCRHSSNTRFQLVTDHVAQLDLVVNDALTKTGLGKVHVLGTSFGGPVVGKYLGDDVSHQTNVAGAIFLASIFNPPPDAASPTGGTWPLGLIDRADAMANFNLAGPTCRRGDGCVSGCTPPDPDCGKGFTGCPGQQDPGIPNALWEAIQARDPVGRTWGPGGLSRYPIVPRFDWNETVTGGIDVPALVMNGLKDSVVAVAKSPEIYESLASDRKILVQLSCASHVLHLESCSSPGCVAPRENAQKLIGDWVLTGMIFTDRGHETGSFETAMDGTLMAAPR
jgi:alpha-beta hydrolase superfamily lysophospholipase